MLPIPPINAHPNTEVKDSCNCCNPVRIWISRSNHRVKESDEKLNNIEHLVKETGSTIISTSGKMIERKRSAPRDVREMW